PPSPSSLLSLPPPPPRSTLFPYTTLFRSGIIGVGNIGRVVADRARGLKMKVIAYDPFLSAEAAARAEIERVALDDLFARADYVTDRKSTRLNSSHRTISYAVFCLKKKKI